MDFLKSFSTRWDNIPEMEDAYRLLCSHPMCSLSCANLKHGKLSITSIHGIDRHSYELSKPDMVFIGLMFLNSLSKKDLDIFTKFFNKISPTAVLTAEHICDD